MIFFPTYRLIVIIMKYVCFSRRLLLFVKNARIYNMKMMLALYLPTHILFGDYLENSLNLDGSFGPPFFFLDATALAAACAADMPFLGAAFFFNAVLAAFTAFGSIAGPVTLDSVASC